MQFSQIAIRGCAMGLVAVSMLLAGCSSVPLDESAKVGTTQDDAATKHRSASGAALDRNAVYFDFDSYTVKPEFMPVVELLPPGAYTRIALCQQMNSSIAGHGWGYTYGTVE